MSRPANRNRVVTGKIRDHLPVLLGLLVLVLAALGRILVDADVVLSSAAGDVASQFLYSRGFAAAELRGGNFPLWNPFLYSGTPFLGDFSSALLYPPNLIFLFAPLSLAISWSFAFHLFVLGAGMSAWAAAQGLRKAASFTVGAAAMFSATVMVPIHAGQLADLCSMTWMPFIFLGMDRWMASRRWGWIVLGAGAAALQIYAGQPAYFLLGAVVAALYALTLPWKNSPDRGIRVAGLIFLYPLALVLGAAQWLPGLATAVESVPADAAGSMAVPFPLERSLTLLVPWMFGRISEGMAPGSTLFGGLGILLLAVFGLWNGGRIRWRLVSLLVGVFLLALGVFSPIGRFLLGFLPGGGGFQGTAQFVFFIGLFLSLSAGLGVGDLFSKKPTAPWPTFLAGTLAILLLLASMVFRGSAGDDGPERPLPAASGLGEAAEGQEARMGAIQTANALRRSGLVLGGFAVLWGWGHRRRGVRLLLVTAAVGEVFFFARSTVTAFPFQPALYEPVRQALWNIPGDFRIRNLFKPNANMLLKREGIWGDSSTLLRRYSRLFAATQEEGRGPGFAQGLARSHPVWEMFRCAFKAVPEGNNVELVNTGKPYPRFYFASEYAVMEPGHMLETLAGPDGDWREKILLEEEPIPAPSGKNSRVHLAVRDVSINHYTLEIIADAATILVNTDSYSGDWRAVSLPGSAQIVYRVLPVNYAMRGIPLTAGSHLLRLEYRPSGLAAGSFLTLGALVVLAGWFFFPVWSRYLGTPRARLTEAGS